MIYLIKKAFTYGHSFRDIAVQGAVFTFSHWRQLSSCFLSGNRNALDIIKALSGPQEVQLLQGIEITCSILFKSSSSKARCHGTHFGGGWGMSLLSCTASTMPAICGGSRGLCRGRTVCVLGADRGHHIRTVRKCCLPSL